MERAKVLNLISYGFMVAWDKQNETFAVVQMQYNQPIQELID